MTTIVYSEKVPTTQETTDTIMSTGILSDEVVSAVEKCCRILYTGTHHSRAVRLIASYTLTVCSFRASNCD